MEYTPSSLSKRTIREAPPSDLPSLTRPTLIRRLRIESFSIHDDWLILHAIESRLPLAIKKNHQMTFGTEAVSAIEYLKRVLEKGDFIDIVAHPVNNGKIPIEIFWIHIIYIGELRDAGRFSQKEDGLFAMRAKAGEKAERIVARVLRNNCGHTFDSRVFETPGYFEIRYDGTKKQRRPDLKCLHCHITFEVKKRNRDTKFRVSHSEGRPFCLENSRNGWHAFVFPDMKPRFLSNLAIATAIANGDSTPGVDRYDSWADVHGSDIFEMTPPKCA